MFKNLSILTSYRDRNRAKLSRPTDKWRHFYLNKRWINRVDKKQTEHYFRKFDIDKQLLSSIDDGILILDEELHIYYFNKWLEIHTSLKQKYAITKKLIDLYPNINTKTLKRKIKTILRIDSPTFYSALTSKYLISIKINQIKISNYSHMQQDISIVPFDNGKEFAKYKEIAKRLECDTYFAKPYEVFKKPTGIDAIILVKGIRL